MEDDRITATYPAPVAHLLTLDAPDLGREWLDYPALGLGPEHVPDLICLATAEVPTWADDDSLEVWGPVHAWRALGQLQAVAAIPSLLARLTAEEDNDWLREDLPRVFGGTGPAAIPPLVAYRANPAHTLSTRITAASGLAHIGTRHPEVRQDCVTALVHQLEAGEPAQEEVGHGRAGCVRPARVSSSGRGSVGGWRWPLPAPPGGASALAEQKEHAHAAGDRQPHPDGGREHSPTASEPSTSTPACSRSASSSWARPSMIRSPI